MKPIKWVVVVIILSAGFLGLYFMNRNETMPAILIEEKITVINNTPAEIIIVNCRGTAKETKETISLFGPIPSNKNGSGFLKVSYPTGIFTVEATQLINGKEVKTTPFTGKMNKNTPLTPLTLTLGTIPWGKDQFKSVWQKAEWEAPTSEAK